jgi:uncharacterized protein DUF3443
MRSAERLAVAGGLAGILGCGGSGGSAPTAASSPGQAFGAPGPNVQPVVVNAGPAGNYANGIFTSVTVCVPATTECQTIDGVLVDTGSSGLRLLSSVLTLPLPLVRDRAGAPIAECNQFQDSYQWGPLLSADVRLAGETAPAVPLQSIGDPAFSSIPEDCASSGLPLEDSVEALGANGILGIGLWRQDCGPACAATDESNPGLYYTCAASGCRAAAVDVSRQAQNPVWLFPTDNNGVALQLPSLPDLGAAEADGSLVLGIGTRANNASAGAAVLRLDDEGNFTTVFAGTPYSASYLDSGTNGLYFLDPATTGLQTCADTSDFYCPTLPVTLSATNVGLDGAGAAANFRLVSADALFDTPNSAFSDLGGPRSEGFAWGLPFFFGRTVFTAIEGQDTPAGAGPWFAY